MFEMFSPCARCGTLRAVGDGRGGRVARSEPSAMGVAGLCTTHATPFVPQGVPHTRPQGVPHSCPATPNDKRLTALRITDRLDDAGEELLEVGGEGGGDRGDLAGGELAEGGGEIGQRSWVAVEGARASSSPAPRG